MSRYRKGRKGLYAGGNPEKSPVAELTLSGNLPPKKLSLPFKGRVGVGMGISGAKDPHLPPVLPLEGGGQVIAEGQR